MEIRRRTNCIQFLLALVSGSCPTQLSLRLRVVELVPCVDITFRKAWLIPSIYVRLPSTANLNQGFLHYFANENKKRQPMPLLLAISTFFVCYKSTNLTKNLANLITYKKTRQQIDWLIQQGQAFRRINTLNKRSQ